MRYEKGASGQLIDEDEETIDETFTPGRFYELILDSTILFAVWAFIVSLFNYFEAENRDAEFPIKEYINMGTLLISGGIVGLLTAVKWLMGAMSTHLSNQAQIIELISKKDGDE